MTTAVCGPRIPRSSLDRTGPGSGARDAAPQGRQQGVSETTVLLSPAPSQVSAIFYAQSSGPLEGEPDRRAGPVLKTAGAGESLLGLRVHPPSATNSDLVA